MASWSDPNDTRLLFEVGTAAQLPSSAVLHFLGGRKTDWTDKLPSELVLSSEGPRLRPLLCCPCEDRGMEELAEEDGAEEDARDDMVNANVFRSVGQSLFCGKGYTSKICNLQKRLAFHSERRTMTVKLTELLHLRGTSTVWVNKPNARLSQS